VALACAGLSSGFARTGVVETPKTSAIVQSNSCRCDRR
jgi:hypothetical protein